MLGINKNATDYLNSLTRVNTTEQAKSYGNNDVLLLPDTISINVQEDSNIQTIGLSPELDKKRKDLLRIIEVTDALELNYKETNILSPSVYVHSLEEKPWHITTQGFLITNITPLTKDYISKSNEKFKNYYGKHEMDSFWLKCSKPYNEVAEHELVCIFNRRVSGWDGSVDRPVIELLGAGGHLQSVWNDEKKTFVSLSLENNLKKEFSEEIGLNITSDDINQIGGFLNTSTQELVIFSCIYIDPEMIPNIQNFALNNIEEDTDGIYLGTFKETMEHYRQDPRFFAGGVKASKTNFPNNDAIMDLIYKKYQL